MRIDFRKLAPKNWPHWLRTATIAAVTAAATSLGLNPALASALASALGG